MLALLDQTREPFVSDDVEAAIARQAADRLESVAKAGQGVKLVVESDPSVIVPLSAHAVGIIHDLLVFMAERRPVSIIPHDAQLTTQQAADYLNVSRPYLVKLVDDGEIPATLVGRHRRVKFADLIAFEGRSKTERRKALAELAEITRSLNLE